MKAYINKCIKYRQVKFLDFPQTFANLMQVSSNSVTEYLC